MDLSDQPVELVARWDKFRDRRLGPQFVHPDIWTPIDWIEPCTSR